DRSHNPERNRLPEIFPGSATGALPRSRRRRERAQSRWRIGKVRAPRGHPLAGGLGKTKTQPLWLPLPHTLCPSRRTCKNERLSTDFSKLRLQPLGIASEDEEPLVWEN